ncbi:MAG TPA: hypothetical protein VI814_08020 [Candidatus Limnocylindria bacterium]
MSIRRLFQIVTFTVALALSFSVVSVGNTANACDPTTIGGGLC